jgi:predicted amidohydrolase
MTDLIKIIVEYVGKNMKNHRVACVQMTSHFNVAENLVMVKEFIRQAVEEGAELIVLPEMFAVMGLDQMDKVKYSEAYGHGPIQDFLKEQAATNRVWIVGGTIPIAVENDKNKVYAACLVWNDKGECAGRYDKIHLFDVSLKSGQEVYSESKTTQHGEKVIVVPTPFGKLGLAVCYDIRFPELFRQMQKQGAEIIALPSAFTYTTGSVHWEVLVRARAIENLCYVLAACQTGTHPNGRRTYGYSMIVNPWGEVKACLPEKTGVVVADIFLEELKEIRKNFPALDHRKF